MPLDPSRRTVLALGGKTILVAGGLGQYPDVSFAEPSPPATAKPPKKDKGPPLEDALVKEFVGAAHGNLDKVKQMLAQKPTLINATWDWGGGDWETALGGAGHMGRRDIAEYLLANGARLDVFVAAMLGKLEIVKAAVIAFPDTPKIKGPHGIPLIRHAEAGGEQAVAVKVYLETLG
jgi:hypothetical protein